MHQVINPETMYNKSKIFLALLISMVFYSQTRTMGVLSPLDPSSFSRPDLAVVKHVSLSLNINFEDKVLSGSALLEFDVREDVNELILDVGSQSIESIEEEDGTPLQFKIDEEVPNFGSKLTISLPKQYSTGDKIGEQHQVKETDNGAQNTNVGVKKIPLSFDGYVYRPIINDGAFNDRNKDPCKYCFCFKAECLDKNIKPMNVENDSKDVFCSLCHCTVGQCFLATRVKISIKYSTAPSATALQWLEPSQTSGKKHPYLYSQCQPIHARSILPCQDTPAVKFTYDAQVTAPDEFTVLMSAIRGERRGNFTVFNQPTPIPSYLLAIAVGVLESRRLGPRSLVWSEKEEIEQSAWEFAETEKYLQAAEQLCGPYVWSQYDLLVLPSSFPYGGMENPCLTFVTPTLLAGDRSQANVIVHEIMHSWTGNLVTNRNFEHFWLNEGFTVFLERKVQASLIVDPNKARITRDFESLLGLQELDETVRTVGVTSPLTHLVMDLNEVHPDDSFSRVPYEKGSLFLRYLEDLVGGPEVFDDFLRCYLQTFAKKSLDTEQFKTFLLNYFKDSKKLDSVDWNAWLHMPGMPPIIPDYDTSMTKSVIALLTKIEQGAAPSTFSEDEIKTFTPSQLIHLLQSLIDRPPLPLDTIRSLGEAFNLNNIKNTELIYRWIRLCIRSKDSSKLEDTYNFVNHIGRMKYVRPIYRDLYAWEEVRKQSIDNFLKNEKYMMHVSAYTLRKDLHLAE